MNTENIMTCAKCGFRSDNDSYFTIVCHYLTEDDIEDWCLECFFKEYDYCGDCGCVVPLGDLLATESGGLFCEKCYPYYAD